jgi:hypothetical protein
MSSVTRHGRKGTETKAQPSPDVFVQLIALARILARQAAREAIAARNASPRNTEQESDANDPA